MDEAVLDILNALREGALDAKDVDRIIRKHSKRAHDGRRVFAKKHVLPHFLKVKRENGDTWRMWNVDADLEARFLRALQMKPRRTASGVATITVITKPWPCANSCVYCPNDPRMPKSYLSDEPACQRAERNQFHPYLQVASRLRTLQQMGHDTGKIELIVLGGTWLDYPRDYRIWFISELFRALNDSDDVRESALTAEQSRQPANDETSLPRFVMVRRVRTEGRSEVKRNSSKRLRARANFASSEAPPPSPDASSVAVPPVGDDETSLPRFVIEELHAANEHAEHRVVGLVVETRPDTITCEALREMRELGCTKVQMGVQSVDDRILEANGRRERADTIRRAFELTRLFGFKTHAHFMVNLLGATPESDKRDYRTFVNDPAYRPDEVKLYPCALVAGTELVNCYNNGTWRPYTEEELVDVLSADMLETAPYTRVSRMIRDISAADILVGNKKTNLRQIVDEALAPQAAQVHEIRFREISTNAVDLETLKLDVVAYETTATDERFLQWVTPEGKIAGFLRLSLPHPEALSHYDVLPIAPDEAMIREVHVYGFATAVDAQGSSAQHHGLGRALVERACDIAREAGFRRINVISAVGTREYYRKIGFSDNGLYQQKPL